MYYKGIKKILIIIISNLIFSISIYSANITGATLCGNFDDYATVYVNGNSIGGYNYINWDSGSPITCRSVSAAYLNASGSNVIAIKVQDTNGGEIWASWYMDVSYDNGQHAYVSSNQGGGKIASTYDCNTAPPNDGSGNTWTAPSYANHSSWPNAVVVTGTTWGKVFYDPSTGRRLQPYSYDSNGSSSGHPCLYMRWGVTLTPQNPPPGPTFSITKTASKTTDITTDNITFTLRICNTGGYTTSRVYIYDQWSTNEFGYDGQNSANNQNSAYGPNFSNSGQVVTVDFPNGFEGNTCINVWFRVQDYYFDSNVENCQVRNNFASVYYGGSSRGSSTVTLRMRCVSLTPTPTRTRTPAPTSTYTRTLTPTPSRTLTPSPSRTPTPYSTPTFTSTRTLTPSPSRTPTPSPSPSPSPSRTPTPTMTRTPSPSPSPTPSRTPTPSPSPSPSPSRTPTPSPSPSPTPSRTPTPSPSPSPTSSRTSTPSPSLSPSPSRTSTPTYSRTPTQSYTNTRTNTQTPTRTWTDTISSNTPTITPTYTQTSTRTATPTNTLTRTPTPTFTNTVSPSLTNSRTATPTYSNTPTQSYTNTRTNTQTPTRTWTDTISSNTPTITPTYTQTSTRTATPTNTLTRTPTPTFTNTVSPSLTNSRTATPSFTQTATNSQQPTITYTISSNTPTNTPTYTNTRTRTPTYTNTSSPTSTYTSTSTPTDTNTHTSTPSQTDTRTQTPTLTFTDTISSNTPTVTRTWTNTWTVTPTLTNTSTATSTRTQTNTLTMTLTATDTSMNTATNTPTVTRTWTDTRTSTVTLTGTPTVTITRTSTETMTQTYTMTFTPTPTYTATFTLTPTVTVTPDVHSALLEITLTSDGENAQVGALIEYKIIIENKDSSISAYNIRIWDTLPAEVEFIDSYFLVKPEIQDGVVIWQLPEDMILKPGDKIIIEYRVKMSKTDGIGFITNTVCADYQDEYYNDTFGNGRHPVITSNINEYPEEMIIAYPNPYKISGESKIIKFVNLPPNCTVQIYTISGEGVISLNTFTGSRVVWDGKNRSGREVSTGIYYYVVLNKYSKQIVRGKIFIIK